VTVGAAARPMSILVVLLKPERGDDLLYGAELSAIDVAGALDRRGAKVGVVQWHDSPLPKSGGIHLYKLTVPGAFSLLKLAFGVARAAKDEGSDVIYAYGDYFENSMVPAYLASVFTGKKFAVAVLDDGVRATDEKGLPSVFADRIASGHSFRSSLRFAFFHGLRRFALRTTATSLVTADSVASYARNTLRARHVSVVPLGIDPLWFGRSTQELTYDAIYVGGLWAYKSVDVLIAAWKDVVKARPEAKLLVLGEGKERPRLESLVSELRLSGSVSFKGYVPTARDVHDLMSRSRVFAFPSVFEGWGRVVNEAMATGLPCVLSDIDVFKELYSESAVLVRAGEPRLFAEAIIELLKDRGKYDELVRRGGELTAGLTWDSVGDRMLKVLQESE